MYSDGILSLQTNDGLDIFYKTDVIKIGEQLSDELIIGVEDPQFEVEQPYITGIVTKMQSVDVSGDTTVIQGWYKSRVFAGMIRITVYIEYEEVEELVDVQADEAEITTTDHNDGPDLETQEIHL